MWHQNKYNARVRHGGFQTYPTPKKISNTLGTVFHLFLISLDQLIAFDLIMFWYVQGFAAPSAPPMLPVPVGTPAESSPPSPGTRGQPGARHGCPVQVAAPKLRRSCQEAFS